MEGVGACASAAWQAIAEAKMEIPNQCSFLMKS
jgi:hypothetical protein